MLWKKTLPLINKVAEELSIPPEIVADVMTHHYNDLKKFINNPTHASYLLPGFGIFVPYHPILYHDVKRAITLLRSDRSNPEYLANFRTTWSYYRMAQQDKHYRKFKKRYGKWHWKKESTHNDE